MERKETRTMVTLDVTGMVCGGCARSVTASIAARDPSAAVTVLLEAGRVELRTTLTAEQAAEAINAAGFEARPAPG